ncbi:hypothetical protein [Arthrobacter cupressi]|uniref:Uncharacterized protein n=1 Tax=Arthrobacter cupressi TaxID=1045773 RepID=A0A1G8ISK5_9MICC|nr:hypothetical protein [Arthrobacter cupressi]NYD79112.1 hypothetical protein [Arthrobacter cupressi]SDI21853.1 hypothetical protein SAMN05216555_101340 [Arthrobacter cupressi]
MSPDPDESTTTSPAVRWGLGAVLCALLAVSMTFTAAGNAAMIAGAVLCGAAACFAGYRAVSAARARS